MTDQDTDLAATDMPPPLPLEVDAILEAARQATGLSDFGDEGFMDGLTRLVNAVREEGNLHEGGKIGQPYGFVRLLSNRLRYIDDVKKHPEILDEKIEAPIIIAGLPRTGTSKLQRVLSGDPNVQTLQVWKLFNPAPYPGEDFNNPVERIAYAKGVEEVFKTQYPGWMAMHPMEAEEPDEELFIMEMSFECAVSSMVARSPSFREYATHCDPTPTYDILHKMLQYLQWQDGGARGRPWIMKSPCHIGYLDTLFKFFPDAIVIHSHREPIETVPSFGQLIVELRKNSTDTIDPVEVAHEWFEYWASLTDKYLEVRDSLPMDQIVNATFDDICNNPLSVIEEVYKKSGRELTDDVIESCLSYEKRRPDKYWGSYKYSLEEFGITEEEVNERFKNYRALFC